MAQKSEKSKEDASNLVEFNHGRVDYDPQLEHKIQAQKKQY